MTVASTDEIKQLFLELQGKNVAFFQPLKTQPWEQETSSSKTLTETCFCSRAPPSSHSGMGEAALESCDWPLRLPTWGNN